MTWSDIGLEDHSEEPISRREWPTDGTDLQELNSAFAQQSAGRCYITRERHLPLAQTVSGMS